MYILSQQLDKLTINIFKKKGNNQYKIITQWNLIVGEEIAKNTIPKKINFTKKSDIYESHLEIYVKNSSIAVEIEYSKKMLIERIASYFGYKYVSNIKTIINTDLFKSNQNNHHELYEKIDNYIDKNDYISISIIEDNDLRNSLQKLKNFIAKKN